MPHTNVVRHVDTWQAPHNGLLKLKCDASYLRAEQKVRCEVVLQDHAGPIVFTARESFTYVAILFGLQTVRQKDRLVQIMETDSLLAVREIKNGKSSNSEWLNLILSILVFKNSCGFEVFSFVKCNANELAHRLATTHNCRTIFKFGIVLCRYVFGRSDRSISAHTNPILTETVIDIWYWSFD